MKVLFQARDYRLNRFDNLYSFVKCKNCQLITQYPPSTEDEMVEHYNENTLYQGSENYSGIKKQIHEFGLNKRVKVSIRKKQNGLLLDIGCGSGSFIKYVAQHTQFKVMGTEVNKKQVDRLQKTDAFPILLGDISQLSLPSDHFDVITLWDVIEHVPDPISMLTEINKIIKPDGLVVIRVPNGNSLNSKLFGKYWAGIDAPRHYYVFTNETLSMLFNKYRIFDPIS